MAAHKEKTMTTMNDRFIDVTCGKCGGTFTVEVWTIGDTCPHCNYKADVEDCNGLRNAQKDSFFLDYEKFQKGELSSAEYAHKYNLSVPKLLKIFEAYGLNVSNS